MIFRTLAITAAAAATTPYPSSARPTEHLYVLSSESRSPAELLCLDSLAGLIARSTPRLCVSCSCDAPGAGAAGHNRYSCSDGTQGYCTSDDECYATLAFAKGDWQSGCRKAVT